MAILNCANVAWHLLGVTCLCITPHNRLIGLIMRQAHARAIGRDVMTRRTDALELLDKGWSCQQVAHAFLLDDDTIRGGRKHFEQNGIEGLTSFDVGGSTGFLSTKQ